MGLLTLPYGLVQTQALLEAAETATVRWQHTRWPALERVLRILRQEFREADHQALAAQERLVVSRAWAWVRACLDGPVPPNHPSTGLPRLQDALSDAVVAVGTSRLTRLQETVDVVTAGDHPLGVRVAEILTEVAFDAADQEPAPCALIVRGAALEGVSDWARDENLWVDVVTYRQARDRVPWRHAVLFGPPERYVASAWLTGRQAGASAGWLLGAPPAREMTVLTWSGHGRLNPAAYAPWQGGPVPEIEQLPSDEVADDLAVAPPQAFTPVPPPNFADEGLRTDKVWMAQFLYGGQQIVTFYHPTAGPRPAVVTTAEGRPHLEHLAVRSLLLGQGVLMRTSAAGRRDALDDATVDWLSRRGQEKSFAEARRLQHRLKAALRDALDRRGQWRVVDALVREGLRDDYAQTLSTRLLHPDAIAPLRWEYYASVCRTLGLGVRPEDFDTLCTYRTARQQAGLTLNDLLMAELPDNNEIEERLEEDGGLLIRHEKAGGLALLRLCAVARVSVSVPTSRLGVPLTQDGEPWQH